MIGRALALLLCGAGDAGTSISLEVCDASFCGDPALNARYRSISPTLAVDDRPPPAPPSSKPKPSPSGTKLSLTVGEKRTVTAPCSVTRFAFGNHPWDLRVVGNDVVQVEGLGKGAGTILGWCSNGVRFSWPIEVR